jgi:predicted nucleic-acid-binding protein
MSNIVLADTNLIIRYLIADDKKLFEQATAIFNQVQDGTKKLAIEAFVTTEVIYVLSSFYKVPKEEIKNTLLNLISYRGIIIDKELTIKALDIYSSTNLHIVDCLLAAKSLISNQDIATFDKELIQFVKKSISKDS